MKNPFIVKQLVVGQMAANCYLVINGNSGEALVIDPGEDFEYITDILEREKVKPLLILATHGHFDHLLAAGALQLIYKLPFLINKKDEFLVGQMSASAKHFLGLKYIDPAPLVTGYLNGGLLKSKANGLGVFKEEIEVIETPGHTPGSVCFYVKRSGALFAGDLVFAGGSVGRTDYSYSRTAELKASVKKILSMPGSTKVYPGHGEPTDIATLTGEVVL